MSFPYPQQTPAGTPTCYRHPDRPTLVGCTRCGRPTCPECMRSASVGHQCVDCVQAGVQNVQAPAFSTAQSAGKPWVSYTLIAINVAVFLVQLATPALTRQLSLWVPAVAGGEYHRLVTSAFLHYGITHLLFNMWALYALGPPLEKGLGSWRFIALYGLSALGGSVVVYLFSPLNAATAGASGAIYGLFGASFVMAKRLNLDMRMFIILIVVNLGMTFTIPGISWQGHVGGLITGALVAAAFVYAPRGSRNAVQIGVTIGALALFAALIAWRTTAVVNQFGPMLTHG